MHLAACKKFFWGEGGAVASDSLYLVPECNSEWNSKRWDLSFVPTVLELNLQNVGGIGRIFGVLGHHVQVSWSMLLKNTQIHCVSHIFSSGWTATQSFWYLINKESVDEKITDKPRDGAEKKREGWWMKRRGLKKNWVDARKRNRCSIFLLWFHCPHIVLAPGRKEHWETLQTHLILGQILFMQHGPNDLFIFYWWKWNALQVLAHKNTTLLGHIGGMKGGRGADVCPAMRPGYNYTALRRGNGQWAEANCRGGLCKITTGCI